MSFFSNNLCLQVPSTRLSENWANQCRKSVLPLFKLLVKFLTHESSNKVYVLQCTHSQVLGFSGSWSCKMGKAKSLGPLQNTPKQLGKENKQKKGWRNKCAWIILQWISTSLTICWYQTHLKSLYQHPSYCYQVPKFLQSPYFILTQFFDNFSEN